MKVGHFSRELLIDETHQGLESTIDIRFWGGTANFEAFIRSAEVKLINKKTKHSFIIRCIFRIQNYNPSNFLLIVLRKKQ